MRDGKIHRIDPPDCGCTDCILRDWSIPIDTADTNQVLAMLRGDLDNATGYDAVDYAIARTGDGSNVLAIVMPWQRDAFDDAMRTVAAVTLA